MKLTISKVISLLIGFYVALTLSVYYDLLPIIVPAAIQKLQPIGLLKLLSWAILQSLLFLLFALAIYLTLKIRLVPKFGVLWDKKNKEPYCPVHKIPLARHKTKIGSDPAVGLDCRKCKEKSKGESSYPLIDDDNKRLTLLEAKKLL